MAKDIRDSTDTYVRKQVAEAIKPHVLNIEDYKEATQTLVAQSVEQMTHYAEVQAAHHETLFGKLPPDPENPGVWRMSQDNHEFITGIKKLGIKFITAIVGAAGVAAWALLR